MALTDLLLESIGESDTSRRESVPKLLNAIRHHLQMDVAFVSEFANGRRIFREVDPLLLSNPVQPDAGGPLEESYCQRVVDGRLPELIQDARQNPEAASLPVTHALPVGAHLSVPIRLADGSIYGTFCCFSYTPDQTLDQRDLNMMRVFADVAAQLIESERAASVRRIELEQRIRGALDSNCLSIVYQPIYDLELEKIVGFEALSRFNQEPHRSPDNWFNEAREIGLGQQLEAKAINIGMQALDHFPENVYLSVNISPENILDGALDEIFKDRLLHRIMLEITEHAVIEHYEDLSKIIRPFRERGLQIAVDDAGAGYASFRHILNLAPDRIKLDMSLTRNIDSDNSRRALAAAFAKFSEETGAAIVAEGVETASQIDTLRELGVSKVQGFYIGHPVSLQNAVQICSR